MTPTAVQRLLALGNSPDCFGMDQSGMASLQLDAVDERFQEFRLRIPLLRERASQYGIREISDRQALVPLLFADTAYRDYDRSWLVDGRWDLLVDWLRRTSAYPLNDVDITGVRSLGDFADRIERVGYFLSSSSGATDKPALTVSSGTEFGAASRTVIGGMSWATGITPAADRTVVELGPRTRLARNEITRRAIADAYGLPGSTIRLHVGPLSFDDVVQHAALQRSISDRTASPTEIAENDAASLADWATHEAALHVLVRELIDHSHQKLLLGGTFVALHRVADLVRAMGISGSQFSDQNAIITGGLRDDTLPRDHREFVGATFNVAPKRIFTHYSIYELNTSFPQCSVRRYHVPPWVVVLPLGDRGDILLTGSGEIEGRAAFFDVSIDGRWGGIISGDLVGVDFGPCRCGRFGPTVGEDIVRYANLLGGDPIDHGDPDAPLGA